MTRERKLRIGFILGIILFLLGTIDPLEGSVLVVLGSGVLAVIAYLFKDPQWKYYRLAALLILFGVVVMIVLTYFGGIGGDTGRSNAWALLLLPYPAGWLMVLVLLFRRLFVPRK